MKVLLVEDNPGDALLVEEYLSDSAPWTFSVEIRVTLAGAVACLAQQSFDAALIDLDLPDAMGIQAVQALSRAAPSLPLIVLTGRGNDVDMQLAAWGATAFLDKQMLDARSLIRTIVYARESSQAHQQVRMLVEQSPDAMVVLSDDGIVLFANPEAALLLGYSREVLPGTRLPFVTGSGGDVDRIIERPDGGRSVASIRLSRIRWKDSSALLATMRDMTLRVASERRIKALLHGAPDGMIVLDESQRVAFANKAALSLFACDDAQILGQHLDDILSTRPSIHPACSAPDRCNELDTCAQCLSACDGYRTGVRPDGSTFPAEVGLSPVDTACGREEIVIIRDISARLATAARLRRSEEQLRQAQKVEALGKLAGGVAHDFNNLLTAIVNAAVFVRDTLEADHPARSDCEGILQCADRGAALTQQLLAFTRQQPVHSEPIDLGDALRAMEKLLRRVLGGNVNLLVEHPKEPMLVLMPTGSLDQILVNLAVNSRDAMPNGGVLKIQCHSIEVAAAEPAPVQAGRYARLTVTDSGVGMDECTRGRVFEPFFTTKPLGVGTGLGLATCAGILTQAGGHIAVDSKPGAGATFTVWVPLAHVVAATAPPRKRVALQSGKHGRVLVVEDNAPVRQLTMRCLQRAGFDAYSANDAEAALLRLRETPSDFDLLLTDVMLPAMSGIDLARAVAWVSPQLRILLMSGFTGNFRASPDSPHVNLPILWKPFTPSELVQSVSHAMEGRLDFLEILR